MWGKHKGPEPWIVMGGPRVIFESHGKCHGMASRSDAGGGPTSHCGRSAPGQVPMSIHNLGRPCWNSNRSIGIAIAIRLIFSTYPTHVARNLPLPALSHEVVWGTGCSVISLGRWWSEMVSSFPKQPPKATSKTPLQNHPKTILKTSPPNPSTTAPSSKNLPRNPLLQDPNTAGYPSASLCCRQVFTETRFFLLSGAPHLTPGEGGRNELGRSYEGKGEEEQEGTTKYLRWKASKYYPPPWPWKCLLARQDGWEGVAPCVCMYIYTCVYVSIVPWRMQINWREYLRYVEGRRCLRSPSGVPQTADALQSVTQPAQSTGWWVATRPRRVPWPRHPPSPWGPPLQHHCCSCCCCPRWPLDTFLQAKKHIRESPQISETSQGDCPVGWGSSRWRGGGRKLLSLPQNARKTLFISGTSW